MSTAVNSFYGFSTLKYTGSALTNRFTTTTTNQQFIPFRDNNSNFVACNSILVEAGTTDIYFSPLVTLSPASITLSGGNPVINGTTVDFTNYPVYFVPAGQSITVTGMSISGIKLSNATGAQVFVEGLGY